MFAAISTYGLTDVDELSELVKDGFLPIVESVPGFVACYVVAAGDGLASTITICEEKAGVDESTSRAAEWVEEHALDFIDSRPAIVTGAVLAETAATPWLHSWTGCAGPAEGRALPPPRSPIDVRSWRRPWLPRP